MKKKLSKKHHYLPRHYLKGFTNNKNGFYIYDKQEDKIFYTSPDAAFFENHLNTVSLPGGDSSDFLEELYKDIENECWNSLDRIRESNNKIPINLLDKMNLFLFLLFLHWRLPSNIKHAEELTKVFFDENNKNINYFTLKYNNGKDPPKEVVNVIKDSPAFKKTSKVILPFAPFYEEGWSERLENWRFLYAEDGKRWHLVGDNPIITRGNSDHNPLNCLNEFIFPVSGNILLVSTDKPINKDMPPEFVIQFNISIIERAERFIACQNENFLEALIKYYKLYVQNNETKIIITEMFNFLEQ